MSLSRKAVVAHLRHLRDGALHLVRQGRREEALRLFERALEAAPADPTLLCDLAGCQAALGRRLDACRTLAALLLHHPHLEGHRRLYESLARGESPA
ncbi:hypothetical protein dsx2_1655 [Desulfovibrio sp. X2]|uniref:tetratricopeptide repeat protein n=1 Tax=Desulfovibrio sp. X2 TaxID=941449 RepID=UPI0003587A36|nr:tetratricopeptide repeat protein [Desulfovibrio sp. X2]EPR44294.1 hypothetical protein dsx2_1655 [Desulfovibrio sp. X2]